MELRTVKKLRKNSIEKFRFPKFSIMFKKKEREFNDALTKKEYFEKK